MADRREIRPSGLRAARGGGAKKADQGFSVRLDRETEALVRQLAQREQRTFKTIVARAVERYALDVESAR